MLSSTSAELAALFTYSSLGGSFDANIMTDPFSNVPAYILMYVINLLFLLIFLWIVWNLWNRFVLRSSPKAAWYFTIFPLSQVIWLAVAEIYAITSKMPSSRYLYFVPAILFSILADWLLFRSIGKLTKQATDEAEARWYRELLQQQQGYYSYILADQEDAAHIRHDMRNQLQTVTALIESGEAETARSHLKELSRLVDRRPSFCHNTVVNALIHVKQLQLSEDSILLTCHCAVPEDLSVSGIDLCSLFSNLLDNADNAVRSLPAEQRRITLSAQVNGEVLTVRCENPYVSVQQPLPAHRPDGHGLGLIILQDLAEKYHGRLETQSDDEIFTATVWLFPDSIKDQ
jgi:signal transduction histidine kinase